MDLIDMSIMLNIHVNTNFRSININVYLFLPIQIFLVYFLILGFLQGRIHRRFGPNRLDMFCVNRREVRRYSDFCPVYQSLLLFLLNLFA